MLTFFLIVALLATLLLVYEGSLLWFSIESRKAKGLVAVGIATFGLLSFAVLLAYSLFSDVLS